MTVNRIPGVCTQCYIVKKSSVARILDFVKSEYLGAMVSIDRILCFLQALHAMGGVATSSDQYKYAKRLVQWIGTDMMLDMSPETTFFDEGSLGETLAMNYGLKGYSFWKGLSSGDIEGIGFTYFASESDPTKWPFDESVSGFSRDRGLVFQSGFLDSVIWKGTYVS